MKGRQRAAHAVAARRGKLKLSQRALAQKAGVDTKTIGNLERRGKWPIAATRSAIEDALGWPDGEMERIAALPDDEPGPPPSVIDDAFGDKASEFRAAMRRIHGPAEAERKLRLVEEALSRSDADDDAPGEPRARPAPR